MAAEEKLGRLADVQYNGHTREIFWLHFVCNHVSVK